MIIILLALAGLIGGAILNQPTPPTPSDDPQAAEHGWWSDLSRSRLLGIPGDVALPIGFFVVLLLMQMTWQISREVSGHRRRLLQGQKLSWSVCTGIILGVCSVGLSFAIEAVFRALSRTPAAVVVGALAVIPIVLFIADGLSEAHRLGVLNKRAHDGEPNKTTPR